MIAAVDTANKRKFKGQSLFSLSNNYVVIDLETTGLDPTWDELIEVAGMKVAGGAVIDTFQSLIKPEDRIPEFITELTGITNEMLDDAPSIGGVLPDFLAFLGDSVVVAHNANFDINFIYDNAERHCSRVFSNDFIDTMRISRRLFPEERHHRLKDLIVRFGVGSSVDHRALSDVALTLKCYEYMRSHIERHNIDMSALNKKCHHKGVSAKDIQTTVQTFDTSSPVCNHVFVFTGKLERMPRKDAMQIVVNCGGICGDRVTTKTNFLVLGDNNYCTTIKGGKSNKHKKAEMLKLSGCDIEVISESVFYDMIVE